MGDLFDDLALENAGRESPQGRALADVRAFLWTATEAQIGALRAFIGADPLAALEAAERRLLEAGGWREIELGGRWYHPVIGHRWKGAALADEKSRRREQLAAKGGA